MRLLVLVLPLAVAEGRGVKVTVGSEVVGIVAPSFVAHGWEPWMATQAFHLFTNPAVVTAFGHLQGQTIRFGGITADWLDYVVDDAVSAPCTWGNGGRAPFTPGGSCPFSTGALTALLNLLDKAGVSLLFDLNVLVGRNCTQLEPGGGPDASSSSSSSSSHVGKGVPNEWCGDNPAPWNTSTVTMLLNYFLNASLTRPRQVLGFELGNELFAPKHITPQVANADISTAASLLKSVWGAAAAATPPPRLYATGTNDCHPGGRNNSDTMASVTKKPPPAHFGFGYPGALDQCPLGGR